MSNRVETLEAEVDELQATVNGLVEELLETKARIKELEDELNDEEEPSIEDLVEPADDDDDETPIIVA